MAEAIDTDKVRHIAMLARIRLDEGQIETLKGELAGILGYFDKLQELRTDDVEPMAHAIQIHNVLAEDIPARSLTSSEALANAPRRDGDFFMVPKVIGESQ